MPHVGLGQWRANGTPAWAARSWGSSRRNRGKRTLASAESAVRGIAGIDWAAMSLLLVPTTDSRQFVEQRLSLHQVGGFMALGEPLVNGCKKLAGVVDLALLAPQPGKTHGRA